VSTYRISELAERSGVPATTLRFYESAGLLPAARTSGGYRTYNEAAVDRLAFISSAKLLGLALKDISELLTVWEDGACAALRDRLLPLVEARMADADRRGAELAAFSASLGRVQAELSRPAPPGPCGPDCGCVSATADSPGAIPVPLTRSRPGAWDSQPDAWRLQPVTCTLSGAQLTARTERWQDLMRQCETRQQAPDGLRLIFPLTSELAGEIASLAAAEQQCCSFFDFTLQLTAATLVLTVRAPEAADDVLAALFGADP
jgi:DNA-binding transcriptional MerR regulator